MSAHFSGASSCWPPLPVMAGRSGDCCGLKGDNAGLEVACGMAFLIVCGGLLNLIRVISPGLILGIVVAGVVSFIALGGPRRLGAGVRKLSVWDGLMCTFLILGYVNWLCFNQPEPEPDAVGGSYAIFISDDGAYTLAPVQMLQSGGMSIDPFSDRLTTSGLGGESFLQALALAVLPIEYIHLADPGLGFLVMAVLLLTTARLSGPARLALGLLFATYPCSLINASATVIPVPLMLAMVRSLYYSRPASSIRTCLVAALLLAAIMTLKTTLISIAVLAILCWEVLDALMTRSFRPIVLGAMIGLLALAMAFPYMVRSYRASGTLLYPYLGDGYRKHTLALMPHKTAFKNPARPPLAGKFKSVITKPQNVLLLIGCGAAVCWPLFGPMSRRRRNLVVACCAASVVSLATTIAVFELDEFCATRMWHDLLRCSFATAHSCSLPREAPSRRP